MTDWKYTSKWSEWDSSLNSNEYRDKNYNKNIAPSYASEKFVSSEDVLVGSILKVAVQELERSKIPIEWEKLTELYKFGGN